MSIISFRRDIRIDTSSSEYHKDTWIFIHLTGYGLTLWWSWKNNETNYFFKWPGKRTR